MKVGDDRGEFKTLLETPKSAYINVSESKSRIEIGGKVVSFSCKGPER